MKKLIVISAILSVSCGEIAQLNQNKSVKVGPDDGKDGRNGKNGLSCSVEQLEDGAKMICEDGTEAIIVNGKDGQNGVDGVDGVDGVNGIQGVAGINGVDGEDGQDGSAGKDGQDGQSVTYDNPIVEDEDGVELGRLAYVDTMGAFAVMMADGLRAKISNNGYPETFATYFSAADCSGERRVVVQNGQFGNFGLDNFAGDGSFWKIDDRMTDGFHYESREDGDGICDSAPGGFLTSNTYSITEGVELDISVPFGMWPRVR